MPARILRTHSSSALAALARRADLYAAAARAQNTRRAYRADWADFAHWCEGLSLRPLPADAETLLAYLVDRADTHKISTLARRVAAIRAEHCAHGLSLDLGSERFRMAWRGLRRAKSVAPAGKAALTTSQLRQALACVPDSLKGIRDRALLLIGFAGALRRSELVALQVAAADGGARVERTPRGLILHLARSKGDPTGQGASVGIPFGRHPETCPVRAYDAWVAAAGLKEGPLFRSITRHGRLGPALSDRSVALIVKEALGRTLQVGNQGAKAGAVLAHYAGHSLRAGLATMAAARGLSGECIQRHLRHRKASTTAGYIRRGDVFRETAASAVDL